MQIGDGEPREGVIHYISTQLKDSEARCGDTQTECLCLVWPLEGLHYYLDGAVFEVYTDCTAFKSLLNIKTTNRHMLRLQIAIHQGKSRVNRRRLTSRRTAVSIKSCFSRVSVTL
ncbi:hypothetical protein O181_049653 [Austropuccinia psidii MF-1]|uniref:Reverse transcriptase RNase H-like domain-containing protein n=1 Tax=Austropuccinia psidii MF-1 TaxID=1389203 RepID=A0A9Q3E0A5_9BASI|nr:hypothetical protein [Austropuccinia psidii MF-1]